MRQRHCWSASQEVAMHVLSKCVLLLELHLSRVESTSFHKQKHNCQGNVILAVEKS